MRTEFKRFGLSQFGPFVACLEILGSLGLFVGIKMNLFLVLSSAGLALLMLMGVLVRVKSKDMLKDVFPALFFFWAKSLPIYRFIQLNAIKANLNGFNYTKRLLHNPIGC